MRFSLLPRERVFYQLLSELALKASKGAAIFKDLVDHWTLTDTRLQELVDLEHECDLIVHTIMMRLNKTFVTPIDREDIHHLAKKLDDLVDLAQGLSERMCLFGIQQVKPEFKEMTALFAEAAEKVSKATEMIERHMNSPEISKLCIEIHTIENKGDRIFEKALAALFRDGAEALDVIKNKEIYDFIERALDRCEDIADILWGIVVKYG